MTIDLYYLPVSAPCTSVRALAQILGLDLNLKLVDLTAGEHLTPAYLKINPQHTIPALVDNGFNLWESRAILIYLVEQYGKDDSLYPKCPKQRAVINQRLYFDLSSLFGSFVEYISPQIRENAAADPEKLKKLESSFAFLNTFLAGQEYVAGDHLTIADIAILTSVMTIEAVGIEFIKYVNVSKWLTTCKATVSSYQLIEDSGKLLKEYIANLKK